MYFPNAVIGLHVHEFLNLCIHTRGGIIDVHIRYKPFESAFRRNT